MGGWKVNWSNEMNGPSPAPAVNEGMRTAIHHALGWLVCGNTVGLLLSLLLLKPEWQPGTWTYGRWVPVHLNIQLYGWTALPLVAWLFSMYDVASSKAARWAPAAVWAWTSSLALAAYGWLSGMTSGKIFLDWKNGALWGFIAALVVLWGVLAVAWRDHAGGWSIVRKRVSLLGLVLLACVPVSMVMAASPNTYPPIDRTTGGPTGSSLLGSTLIVVGLMLLLPRMAGGSGKGRAGRGTWGFFLFSWVVFIVTELRGGTHFDGAEIFSMLCLLPWAWLIPRDWRGFDWPEKTGIWRGAMLGWWGVLVISGLAMYAPGILDHLKFTQGLVAHSHLAMAGFTTSFCGLLISLLTSKSPGGWKSVSAWHLAVLCMVAMLAVMGWREGSNVEWMAVPAGWREAGLTLRLLCGVVMWGASARWLYQFGKS